MEPEPLLPNPNVSTPSPVSTGQEVAPVSHEVNPTPPEQASNIGATVPQAQPSPSHSQQGITAQVQPVSDSNTQQAAGPAIADDVDVIEKEWVDKAKKIVSTTKDDPYEQEREVSKLQADYLMKRYGKQIKTAE